MQSREPLSGWASSRGSHTVIGQPPIVPVPKADGSIHICGDYKVTVNPVLKVDQYPMPVPENLFTMLAGGDTFTKLDLSQAYQQVLLDKDSQMIRYTRMPFGAPTMFRKGSTVTFRNYEPSWVWYITTGLAVCHYV